MRGMYKLWNKVSSIFYPITDTSFHTFFKCFYFILNLFKYISFFSFYNFIFFYEFFFFFCVFFFSLLQFTVFFVSLKTLNKNIKHFLSFCMLIYHFWPEIMIRWNWIIRVWGLFKSLTLNMIINKRASFSNKAVWMLERCDWTHLSGAGSFYTPP